MKLHLILRIIERELTSTFALMFCVSDSIFVFKPGSVSVALCVAHRSVRRCVPGSKRNPRERWPSSSVCYHFPAQLPLPFRIPYYYWPCALTTARSADVFRDQSATPASAGLARRCVTIFRPNCRCPSAFLTTTGL